MPIYEYQCKKCEYVMEVRHSISETSKSLKLKCEKCGSNKLEKLISAPAIINTESLGSSSCPTGTCPLL